VGSAPPIVGLRREHEVLGVALDTGRHVVIEGPPGTGKSTLLRAIAGETGRDVVFVEGNAELTPARLVGSFDPTRVLSEGYDPANFADGPLLTAMRGRSGEGPVSLGRLLYLEELNRVPEETLNVLITVLAEGEIAVPRLGTVRAGAGFRLIAAMNPFDAVGTARVSQAIADRMCRLVLGYQDEPSERAITTAVTGVNGSVVALSVGLMRATREHRDVRMGSSVRGAIDLVHLVTGLSQLRAERRPGRETARDAAHAALSGRIRVADGVDRTAESIIDELLDQLWPAAETTDSADNTDTDTGDPPGGQGKGDGLPSDPPEAGFQRRAERPARTRPPGRTAARSWPVATSPSARSRRWWASWTRMRSAPRCGPTPTRRRRCSPSWRWPPTVSCARRRGRWPPGCSSSWAAPVWPGPAGPGRSVPVPAGKAISTWTPRWRTGPVDGHRVARSWSPPRGPHTGGPSVCWWTTAAR
jgi:MoxR-like ATPase